MGVKESISPLEFIQDDRYLGVKLWEKQIEIVNALLVSNRVTVRSGHGVGKTKVAAAIAVEFLFRYNECLVVTTAPTFLQVKSVLWPEIRTMAQRCNIGVLNQTEIRLTDKRRMFGFSTDEPQRLQGLHCPNMLVIVDEAGGIKDKAIFDAINGLLVSVNNRLLLIGNPVEPEGYFYESHQPGAGFTQLAISCFESPNIAANKIVIPGLVKPAWIEWARKEWMEGSPQWKARVLGEFPETAEDVLIPKPWVADALERGKTWGDNPPPIDKASSRLGCDVARFGDDKTVIIVRDKHGIRHMKSWAKQDTMETVGQIVALKKQWDIREEAIACDDTGVGGGVTDRLHELNIGIFPINFGERAIDRERFANKKAELYWATRDALNPAKDAIFAIAPEYQQVANELTFSRYSFTSSGQVKIEKKEDVKKRLRHSPDHADALGLTFAPLAPSMRVEQL